MLQLFKLLIFFFTLCIVFVSPKGIKVGFFIQVFFTNEFLFFRIPMIIILGLFGYKYDFSSITLIWGDVIILGVEALFIVETSLFIVTVFTICPILPQLKNLRGDLPLYLPLPFLEPSYEICYFFIKVVILVFCLLYGFKGRFIVCLVTFCTKQCHFLLTWYKWYKYTFIHSFIQRE